MTDPEYWNEPTPIQEGAHLPPDLDFDDLYYRDHPDEEPFWRAAKCQCGDQVYRDGKLFGTIHCWTKNGCSVRLEEPYYLYYSLAEGHPLWDLTILNMELTTKMYKAGGWEVRND